ncbi:cleavage and polyadenylation specificity factor CPSF30 [Aspergillus udagawae]|uniref:Cleavage and polyadenylation specificity factor CPSF30 n=1 Tax=Aspergillus udagawae TaxID=91492 RepID=A0ABQ1BEC7_9EURO|nr:cleavage and polyadenylation specificity factor CPSF30 [Aspergillus udagawae]
MDNAPSNQSIQSGGASNGRRISSEERLGHSRARQPLSDTGTFPRNPPRSENVDKHPESHGRGAPPSAMNMGDMRSTLPGYNQPPMQSSYVPAAIHPHGVLYPLQPLPSFADSTSSRTVSYNAHYSQMYIPFAQQPQHPQQQHQHHHHHHHHQSTSLQHGIPDYQLFVPNMTAPSNVPLSNQTIVFGLGYYPQHIYTAAVGHGQGPPGPSIYLPPSSPYHNTSGLAAQVPSGLPREDWQKSLTANYDVSKTIVDGSTPMRPTTAQNIFRDSSLPPATSGSGTPWGPPRKPKQSGHALWVGNLPAGTTVVDLKDHFSQDATKDIQSVFLISKSNCAFINYKTESACVAALSRFHDSRFHGVRLVCRLRRGLASPGKTSNIGSSATSPVTEHSGSKLLDSNPEIEETLETRSVHGRHANLRLPNRYFIVKSLTVGDLELSRQSGIWATQSHNEDNLNRAYETAFNVYLIFSANKSGEYYGYARMMSPIKEDETLALEMPVRPDHGPPEPEELHVIPTQATATAPTGRIIDDSARGTIFWEADSSEEDEDDDDDDDDEDDDDDGDGSGGDDGSGEGNQEGKGDENSDEDEIGGGNEKNAAELVEEAAESGFQSIGRPFRVQWLSTERVPFHRTRGLRNPWNANREVKIARDGTEIEPSVGERLIRLFHTQHPRHGFPAYHTSLPN